MTTKTDLAELREEMPETVATKDDLTRLGGDTTFRALHAYRLDHS
jgi:hypothetical protein